MDPAPLSEEAIERLQREAFTYDAVGRTAGDFPPGFATLRRSRLLPAAVDLERAAEALLGWRMHTGAGLRVRASVPVAEPGAVVVLGIGLGRLRVSAPCRVVYVVAEADRRGFAYGTLPGHPEGGEERFVVEQRPDGRVELRIVAFSRPSSALAKLGGPVTRRVQDLMTRRYLHALDG